MKYIQTLTEKGKLKWNNSDAPEADGKFRDLSPKDLAAWLIKTRKSDMKKISGSLSQQVAFNQNDDKEYVKKMDKTRIEVYKQLDREDLLESVLNEEDTWNDYPAAAKKNAQKAIDWKEEHGRDEVDAGTPVGWARAHQLAKGENLSTDTVKRMSAFNRHRKNSSIKPELKATPWKDRGYVAWLIWGGDEGVDWAIEKSKEIDAMKESKQMKHIKPLNEAEKYITDEFKVGDKIKTNFGEWEVIETDYAPGKSFIAPFIFKGKDMERVNIPNPPKTNKKAVGYKVTDGDKYPIIGFMYQYKDITKLATVGVDESIDEIKRSMISGTSGRTIDSLEDRKYELKKDVKDARIGNFTNVTLPKGTIIYNLPGGVFADHIALKQRYTSRSSQGPQYFDKSTFKGVMITSMPDTLAAIEKNGKVLESVNEAKMPTKYIGNDDIVFLKTKEDSRGAQYNLYYKGHDIEAGGARFGSEKELEDFAANYILSNQWYKKLRYEDSIPLPESIEEAKRSTVHKAAKKGSYPAVIVVVQDGKVIHQEPVSTPDIAPATFNVMQEKYPKALLHLEDNTGKRLFSEAVSVSEGISIFDERTFGKKGIIIMIDDNGKKVSAIFKDKKNADKFNRNKPSDIKKLLDLAKKTKYPKAIDESVVNEGMSKSAIKKAIKVIDKQIDTETGGDGEPLDNETLQALEQERERLLGMNERKYIKSLNEGNWTSYDYDKWTKENGKPKYPKWVKTTLKEIVKGGFMEEVYDDEHNYMVLWLASLENKRRSELYAYDKKGIKEFGKVGYAMYQRFYNDLTGYNMFFMQGAMYALEVSKHIQDRIANGEPVEPAYYMMKEYFNGFGMKTDRSRVFNAAYEKLEKWMKDNQIETL